MVAEMSEAYLFPTSSVPATSRFPFRSPLTFLEDSRFDQELLAAEKAWASRKSVKGIITNHLLCVVVGRRKRRITYQRKIIRMLENILKTQKSLPGARGTVSVCVLVVRRLLAHMEL